MNGNSIKLKEVLGSSELQELLSLFNNLDKRKRGVVSLTQTIKVFKENRKLTIWNNKIMQRVILTTDNFLSFDQFLAVLWQTEIQNGRQKGLVNFRIVEFLQLLEDYRKKCELEGLYADADKANSKIIQIKQKQIQRQKQNFLKQQQQKVQNVTSLQQNKLIEFNNAWNNYMEQYETAAILSLQKLKAKHLEEAELEERRIRNSYEIKIKHSKLYNQLKTKEKNLVKFKFYKEAEKVKMYCDALEASERKDKEMEIQEKVIQVTEKLRKHQEAILLAHLKRIEKDRNQQLKQRKEDSQRMLIKLKHMKNDIVQKQSIEIKDALVTLRETMCLQSGVFKKRPKRIQSLDRINIDRDEDMQETRSKQKNHQKTKNNFKIRINSFNRPKGIDNSLYDP